MTDRVLILFLLISFNTVAQKPEARWLQEMTYDEANNQVLMFGGANETGIFSDLWAFKDSVWKKLSDVGPTGSIKSAFAYDANRKCAILFGGSGDGNKPLDETWEWNGKEWKRINIPSPPARSHPMAVYDPENKVIIIFGGVGATGLLYDTWIYDGSSWKQKNADGPKNCLPHGIFYDEKKEKIILITFSSTPDPSNNKRTKNEMWEWTGDSWGKLSYGTVLTSANSLQSLAPFKNGEVVLFDGDDTSGNNGTTWIFADERWVHESLQGPSHRVGHSMVYDKSNNRTILFGGGDRKKVFNDLWEWNGTQWIAIK
jgi:hypothetical protein